MDLFANDPSTTVSSGGTDAPAAGTTQSWTVASSATFPAASDTSTPNKSFYIKDPAAGKDTEIILVRNVSGTTWSITRGVESTTPVAHTAGFTVRQIVPAAWFNAISVSDYGQSQASVNLANYAGWDSSTTATMRAAQDEAMSDAWGGSWRRYVDFPHHPTLTEHVRDTPITYVEGMLLRGVAASKEFNSPNDIQIRYAGGSQFATWPSGGPARRFRFESLLFSGSQVANTTSQFYVATGGMYLEDVEFVNCSWKYYQNVFDTGCLRVAFMGENQSINNGAGKQLDLRGSDCKIRGNMFVDCFPTINTNWLVSISLNQSEIDRMYITPAPHMGIRFTGPNAGLKARLIINGLTPMLANNNGNATYATTANFPTASTVTGQLFKATNDIKTYRSNGSTYDVHWDGVAPTNVTSLPGGTLGQMVADNNAGVDPGMRYYRFDGTKWVGPKFHPSATLGSYDGADGPGITFEEVEGSMDVDCYVHLVGNQSADGGNRRGAIQFIDNPDEISVRVDHDEPQPHASVFHYDFRETLLPAGVSQKIRLTDNMGDAHLGGQVESPRISASGDLRLDHPRMTTQARAHRPTTWETVPGATLSSGAVVQSTLYLAPFETARRITAARFEVMANVTNAVARIAIYFDNNNGWPGALAYASTATAAASVTAPVKSPSVEPNLPPGRYWVGLVAQTAAANLRNFTGVVDGIPQIAAGGANMTALSIPTVTGAPPDPFPAVGGSPLPANAALLPIVWLQAT